MVGLGTGYGRTYLGTYVRTILGTLPFIQRPGGRLEARGT